jgi:hypothetical protein
MVSFGLSCIVKRKALAAIAEEEDKRKCALGSWDLAKPWCAEIVEGVPCG